MDVSVKLEFTDVLIVGGAPCGLMAGILLARYGIDFEIVDSAAAVQGMGRSESKQLILFYNYA